MFHQFPPTNNRRHLIDKNLHLLATRFYRRDSIMMTTSATMVSIKLPKSHLTGSYAAQNRVMSPEIVIKSVCNISRSLSDNETKQVGQSCNNISL